MFLWRDAFCSNSINKMAMYCKVVSSFLILSCLGGCSSQEGPLSAPPEFGCERSGKFELLTGELPVGNVTDIWEYGPVLIVQGSGGGFLFHVFDKRSGEPLCGFVRNGRGPGEAVSLLNAHLGDCLLYTSPSPRDISGSRMPSSA